MATADGRGSTRRSRDLKSRHAPKAGVSRRSLLQGAAWIGMAAVNVPFIRPAYAARTLKVSTFGGYFEEGLKAFVYPAFQKATGILIESVPQSESSSFLLQLQQAGKAGAVPMDICC